MIDKEKTKQEFIGMVWGSSQMYGDWQGEKNVLLTIDAIDCM